LDNSFTFYSWELEGHIVLGRYERENEGRIWDGRTSNGVIWDKNILVGE